MKIDIINNVTLLLYSIFTTTVLFLLLLATIEI